MEIKEKLAQEIKDAMKARDSLKLSVLRMIKSAIDYKDMEIKGKDQEKDIEETDILKVIQNIAKQRKESIEAYRNAGREETAKKEESELKIVTTFLPKAVSIEEIEKAVTEAIAEVGASSPKEMGNVMKAVMEKFKGQLVDGKAVSNMVKAKLSS